MDREQVTDEFLAVNPAVRETFAPLLAQLAAAGGDADVLAPMLEVRGDYLAAAFDQVDETHGSFDVYLTEGLGLTELEVEALRRTMRG